MTDDCVFCDIIAGNIEAYEVYDNYQVKAFLDANPVSKGHTLVVPKVHAETIADLGTYTTSGLFTAVRTVAHMVDEALDPEGINILQNNGEAAGQEVPHVHVHVIPRFRDDGLSFSFDRHELEGGEARDLVQQFQDQIS